MSGHRRSRSLAHRRAVTVASWTVALTLPAGVGWALWSTSGTGPGAGKARTAVALTVTAGSASADLYPGGTGDLHFSVTNPNPYAVTLTAGTVSSISSVSGGLGVCAASDFTLGTGTMASTAVPAGGSTTVTLTGALSMKSTAGDGCQGADVVVAGTLTGAQS